MSDITLLVAEDEIQLGQLLQYALEKEGYRVLLACNGLEALNMIRREKPNIVLLDIMMPYRNGYQICEVLDKDVGIIMLTAKNQIEDRIKGLEVGADDYITKPFDIREVIARVHALGRRLKLEESNEIKWKECILDIGAKTLTKDEEKIKLTSKEFELLVYMIKNPNKIVSREHLLEKIWGYEYCGETRTIDIHIQKLRKKLKGVVDISIETFYGQGYLMRKNQ